MFNPLHPAGDLIDSDHEGFEDRKLTGIRTLFRPDGNKRKGFSGLFYYEPRKAVLRFI
jgi:hypothetical protein